MKLQAQSSKALHTALCKASKCISSKNSLAILDNVLLTCDGENNFSFISASSSSQLTIPAPLTLFEGTFESPVALPVKTLIPFLATLPDCTTLSMSFDKDSSSISITYCTDSNGNVKEGKASIPFFDGTDFPKLVEPQGDTTKLVLPFPFFNEVISHAANFTAKDELKPQLSCLCMDVDEDRSSLHLVATDGNVLIRTNYTNNPATGGSEFFKGGTPRKLLFPQVFFRTMSVFDGCEVVEIESDGHTLKITANDIEFVCKSVDMRYPNYASVIPTGNPYFILFNKKEMLEIIKRVCVFCEKRYNTIVLTKNGMFLNVSAEDLDYSTASDDQVFIVDSQCAEQFRIGVNAVRMENSLNAIDADNVRMELSAPNRPIVITADDPAPKVLTLCMPTSL